MSKQLFTKIICSLALSVILMANSINISLATEPENPGGGGTAGGDTSAPAKGAGAAAGGASQLGDNPKINQLLPTFKYVDSAGQNANSKGSKLEAVNQVQFNVTWQQTLGFLIRTMLNIASGLALLAFTIGGTMMVLSGQQPALLDKGKKIVIYSLIGLVIMAVAYAIVIGVSELQFFSGGGSSNTSAPAPNPPAK